MTTFPVNNGSGIDVAELQRLRDESVLLDRVMIAVQLNDPLAALAELNDATPAIVTQRPSPHRVGVVGQAVHGLSPPDAFESQSRWPHVCSE
jgi:hypothetical protein